MRTLAAAACMLALMSSWASAQVQEPSSADVEPAQMEAPFDQTNLLPDGPVFSASISMFGEQRRIDYVVVDGWAIAGDDMVLGRHEDLQLGGIGGIFFDLENIRGLLPPLAGDGIATSLGQLEGTFQPYSAIQQGVTLWPSRSIKYRFDAEMPEAVRTWYRQAAEYWSKTTIIDLVEDPQGGLKIHYTPGGGWDCKAQVGYNSRHGGHMWLSSGCPLGAMIHETGHVLGLMHEHQRTERAAYLALTKAGTDDPDLDVIDNWGLLTPAISSAYDICSIMHYSRTQTPLKSKAPWFSLTKVGQNAFDKCSSKLPPKCRAGGVGQRCSLTAADVAIINTVYGDR